MNDVIKCLRELPNDQDEMWKIITLLFPTSKMLVRGLLDHDKAVHFQMAVLNEHIGKLSNLMKTHYESTLNIRDIFEKGR